MKQSFVLGFISVLLHCSLLQNDALGDGGGGSQATLKKITFERSKPKKLCGGSAIPAKDLFRPF